ncbi:MAG: family 4 glycosyl hydrolase, partial [Candidatus Hodarchaeales archaeon]
VVPEKIGNLPDSIATLCNREITIAKLSVEGSIKGDRDLIIQAFALDPMVANLDHAEVLSNDYITTFKNYLPQFL